MKKFVSIRLAFSILFWYRSARGRLIHPQSELAGYADWVQKTDKDKSLMAFDLEKNLLRIF